MRKRAVKRKPVARHTARRPRRSPGVRVALSMQEREVVREACRRYQHDLPTYLQTTRSELGLIRDILRKL